MRGRRLALATLVGGALWLAGAAPAGADQTPLQRFFRERLLADARTSPEIKALLRSRSGFVERTAVFADLTGDERPDAVVRVHSGGVAGIVALYVFSTDTGEEGGGLVPVFRTQGLRRASTQVLLGVLSYRSSVYADGDELCCPAREVEATLRWHARTHRLRVDERHTVPPAPARG